MTTLIDAAKQALDALENAATEVEEWGAYASEYFQNKHDLTGAVEGIRKQAAALRAAIKEAEQHNRCPDCGYLITETEHIGCLKRQIKSIYELAGYEPQPQPPAAKEWQGLTEEEVQLFIEARWSDGVNFTHFIRAIEAKLKEKNT